VAAELPAAALVQPTRPHCRNRSRRGNCLGTFLEDPRQVAVWAQHRASKITGGWRWSPSWRAAPESIVRSGGPVPILLPDLCLEPGDTSAAMPLPIIG
jgi:hypothetical protein